MSTITYREAVARGIAQEMRADQSVVFLGEDVASAGGVFKATVGLAEEFGPARVFESKSLYPVGFVTARLLESA